MPASPKASAQQIRDAYSRNRGNITRAAAEVGMARNNFYKRLENVGAPELPADAGGKDVTRFRATRLTVEQFAALREASFDLAYVERVDWLPDDVLRAFVAEAFPAWLEKKLAEVKAAKGK